MNDFINKLDDIYSDLVKQYELNDSLGFSLGLIDELQNSIEDLTPNN